LSIPEELRVGVIGASKYSELRHLPALGSDPRVRTAAICDLDLVRANEMARKFSIPLVTDDYRKAIDEGDLDAVLVVTPDDTHHAITMKALDSHLHVLCEKPLAFNSGQAREMYEGAEVAGVRHMTFFTFRWLPQYVYLKELIDGGYLGRVYDCYLTLFTSSGRGGGYSWRYDRRYGNGVLSEYGAHMIDLARWLVGDITGVNANLRMFLNRKRPDGGVLDPTNDSAMLALEFAGGAQGVIQVGSLAFIGAKDMDQRITLHGEKGTLEVRATFTVAEIWGAREGEGEFAVLPTPGRIMEKADRAHPFHVRSGTPATTSSSTLFLRATPYHRAFTTGSKQWRWSTQRRCLTGAAAWYRFSGHFS